MPTLPTVVLIDDDADEREVVSLILRGAFGEVTIREASGAAELARIVSEGGFGLVLTEYEMGWIRAEDVVRLVRDLVPGCPVVVLTRAPAETAALGLLHLAPDGLVPKTSAGLASLPQAVKKALARRPAPSAPAPAAAGAGDEMAYVVSHDLRAPVTQVARYLDLLGEEAEAKLGAEGRALFARAKDGAKRLEGMLDALLRCARVESRGEAFAEVALGPLVEKAAARLVEAGEAPAGAVSVEPLPRVVGDAAQLEQLFQNLLGNAVKFRGQEPPRVQVSAEDRGASWLLSCRDNGIGIHPKDAERIFGMFQRLHTAEEAPGWGIGLALCRRIVARHGGEIWVESRPGEGATFRFTLAKEPRARREGPA